MNQVDNKIEKAIRELLYFDDKFSRASFVVVYENRFEGIKGFGKFWEKEAEGLANDIKKGASLSLKDKARVVWVLEHHVAQLVEAVKQNKTYRKFITERWKAHKPAVQVQKPKEYQLDLFPG